MGICFFLIDLTFTVLMLCRILHDNTLIGVIPKELGMLKNLKILDLGMNQLSGHIPPEIGNLTNISKMYVESHILGPVNLSRFNFHLTFYIFFPAIITRNLESNGLTGRLPPELGNLKYLEELWLDRNKLQGTVPAESDSNFTSSMHKMLVGISYP